MTADLRRPHAHTDRKKQMRHTRVDGSTASSRTGSTASGNELIVNDRELQECVREFRDGILNGRPSFLMCYAVCWPLQTFLSICGVETELTSADFFDTNHTWLTMEDGRIIDPTADQFGLEPVYIGPLPKSYEQRTVRLLGAVDPSAGTQESGSRA